MRVLHVITASWLACAGGLPSTLPRAECLSLYRPFVECVDAEAAMAKLDGCVEAQLSVIRSETPPAGSSASRGCREAAPEFTEA